MISSALEFLKSIDFLALWSSAEGAVEASWKVCFKESCTISRKRVCSEFTIRTPSISYLQKIPSALHIISILCWSPGVIITTCSETDRIMESFPHHVSWLAPTKLSSILNASSFKFLIRTIEPRPSGSQYIAIISLRAFNERNFTWPNGSYPISLGSSSIRSVLNCRYYAWPSFYLEIWIPWIGSVTINSIIYELFSFFMMKIKSRSF